MILALAAPSPGAEKTASKGSLTLEISSRFNDSAPEDARCRFGMGMGFAMRFKTRSASALHALPEPVS